MQPSPYTPGDIARPLVGREEHLAAIDERLSYVSDLQRLAARPRIVVAPRGLGKTSLLREAERRAAARGLATVWLTADAETGLLSAMATGLTTLTERWPAAARRRVSSALKELTLSVGVPGVAQVSAKLAGPAATGASARDVERGLVATVEQLAEQRVRGLVLFVDELQEADRSGLRLLAHGWQHLQAERPDLPMALLAAGLPNSQTVWREAASFTERFEYIDLGPLSYAVAAHALVAPARALGVDWHPDAVRLAAEFAGGFPYAVQLVGSAAWGAAGHPGPGTSIAPEHAAIGVDDARRELTRMFESRFSTTTQAERRFLIAMAGLGDGPVRRADLANALGVHSNDLSVPRSALIAKGIIAAGDRRGDLAFTAPGFGAYLRAGPAEHADTRGASS